MSLEKEFEKFKQTYKAPEEPSPFKKVDWGNLKKKANKIIIDNRSQIEFGISAAKTLTTFSKNQSPFVLLQGAFDLVKTQADHQVKNYAEDYFNFDQGWSREEYNSIIATLLRKVIDKFPFEFLLSRYDRTSIIRKYKLPFGHIGIVGSEKHKTVYFKKSEISREKLLDFCVDLIVKEFKSNIFSLDFNAEEESFSLKEEKLYSVQSAQCLKYSNYIESFLKKNLSRSIIFYGPPGTGKTTLAQTIINNFNVRTLMFRYNNGTKIDLYDSMIEKLKIKAVLIDDFDQIHNSNELLSFLEKLKKENKLVIGIVNSLKDFHPAILRPGRFDNIFLIDALDENTVKSILGPELTEDFFEKVKKWPVAYINEFANVYKVFGKSILEETFADLDLRVANAEKLLK